MRPPKYSQLYGYGSNVILRTAEPGARSLRDVPLTERIERFSMPIPESGCWIWMKSGNRYGYGTVRVGRKKMPAHRAAWLAFRGPIPDNMCVCHSCDIPSCVNPDHLSLGSLKENALDRERRKRPRRNWLKGASLLPSPENICLSLAERLEKYSIPEPNSGCHIWIGAGCRYGQLMLNNRPTRAHRIAWELFRTKLSKDDKILHLCDNTWCINPDHLRPGTQWENVQDSIRKGRFRGGRGEKVRTAKINKAIVLLIRESTESHRALAARLGISYDIVKNVRNRVTWKHI